MWIKGHIEVRSTGKDHYREGQLLRCTTTAFETHVLSEDTKFPGEDSHEFPFEVEPVEMYVIINKKARKSQLIFDGKQAVLYDGTDEMELISRSLVVATTCLSHNIPRISKDFLNKYCKIGTIYSVYIQYTNANCPMLKGNNIIVKSTRKTYTVDETAALIEKAIDDHIYTTEIFSGRQLVKMKKEYLQEVMF